MGELHPQMRAILEKMEEAALPALPTLTPAAARAQVEASFVPFWNANPPAVAGVTNFSIPGPGGPIAVRLYDPGVAAPAPCLVYLHGGGWVICSLDSHDDVCRRIALAGRVMVASIDYRLAPEHKFPAGLEDCIAATRWLAAHGEARGIDGRRLAIGGDSAGANLSLATLVALRDAGGPSLRGGLLIYGAYGSDRDTPSHRAFGDGRYILSLAEIEWFLSHYLDGAGKRDDLRAAPLHADLHRLPPLYLTAAEFDPLFDDTVALAGKLKESGVSYEYRYWPGVVHAALHMARLLDPMKDFIAEIGGWLRRTV
jgi:acetyl esterase